MILSGIAGLLTGIVSAWGIGGGTLLVLYMAAFTKIPQKTAQGINLLYFIPVAAVALVTHIKNKMIIWQAAIPAIIAGVPFAVGLALLAANMESDILRRFFGGFVALIGITQLFRK